MRKGGLFVKRSSRFGALLVLGVGLQAFVATPSWADRGYDAYRRLRVQARLYANLGRPVRAAEALTEAFDRYPDEAVLLESAGLFIKAKEPERALRTAERYLASSYSAAGRAAAGTLVAQLRDELGRDAAEIAFVTTPPAATVCLDDATDAQCFKTPALRWVKAGAHVIEVTHAGLASRKQPLDVAAGRHLSVQVTLAAPTSAGRLEVFGPLPGLPVTVDGHAVGKTPLSGVPVRAGSHVVEVALPSGPPWRGRFDVRGGWTTSVYAGKTPPKVPVGAPVAPTGTLVDPPPPAVVISPRTVVLPAVAKVALPKADAPEVTSSDPKPVAPEDVAVAPPPIVPIPLPMPVEPPTPTPRVPKAVRLPKVTKTTPPPTPAPVEPPSMPPVTPPEPVEVSKPTPPEPPEPVEVSKPTPPEPPEPVEVSKPTPPEPPEPVEVAKVEPEVTKPEELTPSTPEDVKPAEPPPQEFKPDADVSVADGPGGPSRWMKITGWTTLGVGIAALGGAVAFHVLTMQRLSQANELDSNDPYYDRHVDELREKTERNLAATKALYSIGGVVAVAGITLIVLDVVLPKRTETTGSSLRFDASPLPGGALLRSTVSF